MLRSLSLINVRRRIGKTQPNPISSYRKTITTSRVIYARSGISRFGKSRKEESTEDNEKSSTIIQSSVNTHKSSSSSSSSSSTGTSTKPLMKEKKNTSSISTIASILNPTTRNTSPNNNSDILDLDETVTDQDMQSLEKEILSVNDEALVYTPYYGSSSIMNDVSSSSSSSTSEKGTVMIDQQYLAPAPGFIWLTFPESLVTLPIPSFASSSSESNHHHHHDGSLLPWRWSVWQGTGSFFGMKIMNTIIAPLPITMDPSHLQLSSTGRVMDPSTVSSSSSASSSSSSSTASSKYETILKDAQNSTAISSPPSLPVQVGIRYYTGLLSSPFFQDSGPNNNNVLSIGKIFIELHMMRNLPPGIVRENQEKIPPRIIHTWQSSGRNSTMEGGDYRDILGIEYEAVSLYGSPPYRHSVTLIIDQLNDRIHEITLSAQAMEWDNLWEGMKEDTTQGTGTNKTTGNKSNRSINGRISSSYSSSTIIDQLRCLPFPSVTELSLDGQKGFQFILNHLTVSLPTLTSKKRRKE